MPEVRAALADVASARAAAAAAAAGANEAQAADALAATRELRFEFLEGHGGEGDTLGRERVYIMDADRFPFHRAEPEQQFHESATGARRTREYRALRTAARDGSFGSGVDPAACPAR